MKLAIQTLNRFLKNPLSTERVVELLNSTEIEVEEIISRGSLDPAIILVQIKAVHPHPNADRLKLVDVDTGGEQVRVVCGAPNVVAGMYAALVQPGVVLPDGTKIKRSKIRGEVSDGMLASGQELALSNDHDGLIDLGHLTHNLGTSLCDIIDSSDILDIKTPANRWDYLSGVGVARELAAYDGGSQQLLIPDVQEYNYRDEQDVVVDEQGVCRRMITAHLIIKNDVKTPSWIVDNLEANGYVSHNPVVDITNYVMLETGQPSHAYDAQKISTPLSVRFASQDETFTSLDGVARTLSAEDMVVCDTNGVVGLAGVIGGQRSQIDTQTTEIILEAAHWDKTLVRRSAVRHGVRTEASSRFERGLPLPLPAQAFNRLLDLIIEICEGSLVRDPADQLYAWPWQRFLSVRLRRAEQLLGTTVPEKLAVDHLHRLGFDAEHFSLTSELRSHLGKPYQWGANFRQHGDTAFDCSYLVDRLYSRLGVRVGHTALGQLHHGWEVDTAALKPGDVLFIEGKIEKSATDHYYTTSEQGVKEKHILENPEKVGHNGIYIGGGKVIQAAQLERSGSDWVERETKGVIESDVKDFIEDPGYLGARRYVESLNHLITVTVPWWRTDITTEVDLIEELGKAVGYDQIDARLPHLRAMPASSQSLLPQQMEWRKYLVAMGLTEVNTYSFISTLEADVLGLSAEDLLPIANPRSTEQAYVRSTLLTSHVRMWAQQPSILAELPTVFEISQVFESRGLVEQPEEHTHAGLSAVGESSLAQVQSALHRLAQADHLELQLLPLERSSVLVPQRSARIVLSSGEEIGMIGQVRPSLARKLGVQSPIAWCEINLKLWLMKRPEEITIKHAPGYQLVQRDISLEVPDGVWWQQISASLKSRAEIWKVYWKHEFTNEELIEKKRRVLTFRVLLDLGAQPNSDRIDTSMNNLITHLVQENGGQDIIILR